MPDPLAVPLTLYGTSGCHLCEQAEVVLQRVLDTGLVARVAVVDISTTETLMQRFAWRIPVLQRADGSELDWPFDQAEVRNFLCDS